MCVCVRVYVVYEPYYIGIHKYVCVCVNCLILLPEFHGSRFDHWPNEKNQKLPKTLAT